MKIFKPDIIMGIVTALSYGEKVLTSYLIIITAKATGIQEIGKVVDAVEVNPIMGLVLKSAGASSLVSHIMLPALVLASYLFGRYIYMKKYQDDFHYHMLLYSVYFMLFIFIGVFLNNLGYYLGYLGALGGDL